MEHFPGTRDELQAGGGAGEGGASRDHWVGLGRPSHRTRPSSTNPSRAAEEVRPSTPGASTTTEEKDPVGGKDCDL